MIETEIRLHNIVTAADEAKAEDIVALDVRGRTIMCDFFVVCTGNSLTHVEAISDGIRERTKELGIRPIGVTNPVDAKWVALDFGDIVVHVFTRDARSFYDLETLWGSAVRLEAEALIG